MQAYNPREKAGVGVEALAAAMVALAIPCMSIGQELGCVGFEATATTATNLVGFVMMDASSGVPNDMTERSCCGSR